jgi:hypothetical protein
VNVTKSLSAAMDPRGRRSSGIVLHAIGARFPQSRSTGEIPVQRQESTASLLPPGNPLHLCNGLNALRRCNDTFQRGHAVMQVAALVPPLCVVGNMDSLAGQVRYPEIV